MFLQACMLLSLLWSFARALVLLALSLPSDCWRCIFSSGKSADGGATFYEGHVEHRRKRPVSNVFRCELQCFSQSSHRQRWQMLGVTSRGSITETGRDACSYSVRMALVSLDDPPDWWKADAIEFLSAEGARHTAGTLGRVELLTNPVTAGYVQNPISVYYCYGVGGTLERCIAEVTNTPWAAKVTFVFDPMGEDVPKALHVSPFMDMRSQWRLKASVPGDSLGLSVAASHPDLGPFFSADLSLKRSARASLRSEEAGFRTLLLYGYQPHRAALLIYWQAVKLLWKGAPFYGPPSDDFKAPAAASARHSVVLPEKQPFRWQHARNFPWNATQ